MRILLNKGIYSVLLSLIPLSILAQVKQKNKSILVSKSISESSIATWSFNVGGEGQITIHSSMKNGRASIFNLVGKK